MSDLTEFVLARIAEDEDVARGATAGSWEVRPYWFTSNGRSWATVPDVIDQDIDAEDAEHIARHDPARVLAECDAKRRIVALAVESDHGFERPEPWGFGVLRLLALPCADHPSYDEAWRP